MDARRTSWGLLTVAVVAVVAIAAGCARSSPSAGPEATSGTAQRAVMSVPPSSPPKDGGSLTYGTEAETDGFDPTKSRLAISGLLMANAVLDPAAAFDADGNAVPYLAKAFEPSPDFRSWTIRFRPGITFTNGQPLDAAAGVQFIKAIKASPLTGAAARPIVDVVAVGDDAVRVDMDRPWPAFPQLMTGQGGLLIAPEQLDRSAAGDPRAATEPIGTGPFIMQEWQKNNHFTAVKNPNYWQEGLPHLDRVEFRPLPDIDTRVTAFQQGQLNATHVDRPETVKELRTEAEAGRFQFFAGSGEDEESFIMLNSQEAPLTDRTLRQALAYATDKTQVAALTGTDPSQFADGPWQKDSKWYAESGFPTYDEAKARQLVDQWKAANGGQTPTFTLSTTTVTENQQTAQLLQQLWERVGFKVDLQTLEQTQFIAGAATGNYNALLWRQFSAPDPDSEYHWWYSENATPKGTIGLNFARFKNPDLDAAIDEGRTSNDPAVRQQAYARVAKIFGTEVPYLWLSHIQWAIVADNDVRDLLNTTLPDGQKALPANAGVHRLTYAWIDR